jgi:hypothetical protein
MSFSMDLALADAPMRLMWPSSWRTESKKLTQLAVQNENAMQAMHKMRRMMGLPLRSHLSENRGLCNESNGFGQGTP